MPANLHEDLGAVQSKHLDHCWICKEKFTEHGGKPNFYKHDHHIVPRAYGGSDGPTYSVCNPHHTALHGIALRLEKERQYHEYLTGNPSQDQRLLRLAGIIVNAKALTNKDPNKAMPILFVAKLKTKERLKALKGVYGLSMQNLIELAIHDLHSKHFQRK